MRGGETRGMESRASSKDDERYITLEQREDLEETYKKRNPRVLQQFDTGRPCAAAFKRGRLQVGC